MLATIVAGTVDDHLPNIVQFHCNLFAMPMHMDASGCLSDSPSLGILVSKYSTFSPLVVTLHFPHKVCAPWTGMAMLYTASQHCLSPGVTWPKSAVTTEVVLGQFACFNLDSIAAVAALAAGRSDSD